MFKHNWAWIKLATDNFSTVLTRNLQNPRDYAPLSTNCVARLQSVVSSTNSRINKSYTAKRLKQTVRSDRLLHISWTNKPGNLRYQVEFDEHTTPWSQHPSQFSLPWTPLELLDFASENEIAKSMNAIFNFVLLQLCIAYWLSTVLTTRLGSNKNSDSEVAKIRTRFVKCSQYCINKN